MNSRKIVRVNVEVIYDDGTLEEMKAMEMGEDAVLVGSKQTRIVVVPGNGGMLCEARD